MKTIEIKLPLILHDTVRTTGRVVSTITQIDAEYSNNEVNRLRYSTNEVNRYRIEDFNKPTDILKTDFKSIKINPLYNIDEQILIINSTYNNIGILKKEKINSIEFTINKNFESYFYRTNKNIFSKEEVYTNIENFINRTKPLKQLNENQKYIFTNYLTQQNNLEVVDVEKVSETHFKIIKGYNRNEIIRGSKLYNSHESFIKHMSSQL